MTINKYDLAVINKIVKDLAGHINKPATIKAALHRVYNLAKSDADEYVDDRSVIDLFNRIKESALKVTFNGEEDTSA